MLGYDKFGSGPRTVIALHGWFGDEQTFAPLYRALDPEAATWICPAYRGYGASKRLEGPYDIDQIAKDVIALADHLNFDAFSLVGHSMGGKAAQRVLADAPSRVEKLVAVTPVPASDMGFDDATYAMFESAVSNPDAARGIVAFSTGGRLSKRFIDEIASYPKKFALDAAFSGLSRELGQDRLPSRDRRQDAAGEGDRRRARRRVDGRRDEGDLHGVLPQRRAGGDGKFGPLPDGRDADRAGDVDRGLPEQVICAR